MHVSLLDIPCILTTVFMLHVLLYDDENAIPPCGPDRFVCDARGRLKTGLVMLGSAATLMSGVPASIPDAENGSILGQ